MKMLWIVTIFGEAGAGGKRVEVVADTSGMMRVKECSKSSKYSNILAAVGGSTLITPSSLD